MLKTAAAIRMLFRRPSFSLRVPPAKLLTKAAKTVELTTTSCWEGVKSKARRIGSIAPLITPSFQIAVSNHHDISKYEHFDRSKATKVSEVYGVNTDEVIL